MRRGWRSAVLSINNFANRQTSDEEPYDQYEVSVPLQNVSACLKKVGALHAYCHKLICVEACARPGLIHLFRNAFPYVAQDQH